MRIESLLPGIGKAVLKVSFCALGVIMLAGCGMQLPHPPELGFDWVSKEGKSREQLYHDQAECRREVTMLYPPDSSGPGDRGWGASNMRAFDDCMRSKGWSKQ